MFSLVLKYIQFPIQEGLTMWLYIQFKTTTPSCREPLWAQCPLNEISDENGHGIFKH